MNFPKTLIQIYEATYLPTYLRMCANNWPTLERMPKISLSNGFNGAILTVRALGHERGCVCAHVRGHVRHTHFLSLDALC